VQDLRKCIVTLLKEIFVGGGPTYIYPKSVTCNHIIPIPTYIMYDSTKRIANDNVIILTFIALFFGVEFLLDCTL